MTYLRNNTTVDQWFEDPGTGIKRKVEAAALAWVTTQVAEHALKASPGTWQLVPAIALPPPSP